MKRIQKILNKMDYQMLKQVVFSLWALVIVLFIILIIQTILSY